MKQQVRASLASQKIDHWLEVRHFQPPFVCLRASVCRLYSRALPGLLEKLLGLLTYRPAVDCPGFRQRYTKPWLTKPTIQPENYTEPLRKLQNLSCTPATGATAQQPSNPSGYAWVALRSRPPRVLTLPLAPWYLT